MNSARYIVDNALDDFDPKDYAFGTADKDSWTVPHPWVGVLRPMGFKMLHNAYTSDEGKPVEFWSMERDVKMRGGKKVKLSASGYDLPELQGCVGIGVAVEDRDGKWDRGIWSSTPVGPHALKEVMADIIRRLERCRVVIDWSYSDNGFGKSINRALKPYEYWKNEKTQPYVQPAAVAESSDPDAPDHYTKYTKLESLLRGRGFQQEQDDPDAERVGGAGDARNWWLRERGNEVLVRVPQSGEIQGYEVDRRAQAHSRQPKNVWVQIRHGDDFIIDQSFTEDEAYYLLHTFIFWTVSGKRPPLPSA